MPVKSANLQPPNMEHNVERIDTFGLRFCGTLGLWSPFCLCESLRALRPCVLVLAALVAEKKVVGGGNKVFFFDNNKNRQPEPC
jgi:hypothetical protein